MTLVSTRLVAASSANITRPLHISVPQEEFVDLHQRIEAELATYVVEEGKPLVAPGHGTAR